MQKYRILKRFSPLVRLALKGIPFGDYVAGGKECGTGHCPLGAALELSGCYFFSPKPHSAAVADLMQRGGLISIDEVREVLEEAKDFILSYSVKDSNWKRAL